MDNLSEVIHDIVQVGCYTNTDNFFHQKIWVTFTKYFREHAAFIGIFLELLIISWNILSVSFQK